MHLIVVNMGTPDHIIHTKYGPYSKWFERAFKNIDTDIMVDGFPVDDVDLEDLLECDGVILSGAEESVGDDLPWRNEFNAKLESVLAHRKPVLGVCFGHQYLADMHGGVVARSSQGQQFGNYPLPLPKDSRHDPLFAGMPEEPFFIQSHYEIVSRPPENARVLAAGSHVPVQAMRIADAAWGVQFHPEMTDGIIMSIIDELDMPDEEKERQKFEANNPHDGLRLLYNFASFCKKQQSSPVS